MIDGWVVSARVGGGGAAAAPLPPIHCRLEKQNSARNVSVAENPGMASFLLTGSGWEYWWRVGGEWVRAAAGSERTPQRMPPGGGACGLFTIPCLPGSSPPTWFAQIHLIKFLYLPCNKPCGANQPQPSMPTAPALHAH